MHSAASTSKAKDDMEFEDIEDTQPALEDKVEEKKSLLVASNSSERAIAVAASISQLVLQGRV